MYTRIMVAGLIALGLATSAAVAGDDNGKEQAKSIYRASNLTGKYVMNGTGENADTLGHIEDIVINLKDGSVVYYVLTHGETLGFGGKYFAIAPEAMRLTQNGEYFILTGVSNKDLDDMKGFDANTWPREPSRDIGKAEKGAVGKAVQGVKEAVNGKDRLARVNRVIGMAVRNPKNENLGSVYDLAMNAHGAKQKVAYAAVSYGGTLGVGGKLYAVPLNKMQISSPELRPGAPVFVINATQKTFEGLEGFTSGDNWPARANETFWGKIRNQERDSD